MYAQDETCLCCPFTANIYFLVAMRIYSSMVCDLNALSVVVDQIRRFRIIQSSDAILQ